MGELQIVLRVLRENISLFLFVTFSLNVVAIWEITGVDGDDITNFYLKILDIRRELQLPASR
jgi:hypothetical protein